MYDYPYDNENLKNYNVGSVNIQQDIREIKITFDIEEHEIGIGLFGRKYYDISEELINDVTIGIEKNSNDVKINKDDKIEKYINFNEKYDVILKIKSKRAKMLENVGIIGYYELNDIYEEDILNDILKQINK